VKTGVRQIQRTEWLGESGSQVFEKKGQKREYEGKALRGKVNDEDADVFRGRHQRRKTVTRN